jgi:hypothetical protein
VTEAWVGVESNPQSSSLEDCRDRGLGVLRVDDGVEELIQPDPDRSASLTHGTSSQRLLDKLENLEPGGTGGYPNRLGKGPAQVVYDRVQKYREQHPDATWKEMYNNIPNHYASHNSMSGAMKSVKKRRRWRERYDRRKKQTCVACGHIGEDHRTQEGLRLGGCKHEDCGCPWFRLGDEEIPMYIQWERKQDSR